MAQGDIATLERSHILDWLLMEQSDAGRVIVNAVCQHFFEDTDTKELLPTCWEDAIHDYFYFLDDPDCVDWYAILSKNLAETVDTEMDRISRDIHEHTMHFSLQEVQEMISDYVDQWYSNVAGALADAIFERTREPKLRF